MAAKKRLKDVFSVVNSITLRSALQDYLQKHKKIPEEITSLSTVTFAVPTDGSRAIQVDARECSFVIPIPTDKSFANAAEAADFLRRDAEAPQNFEVKTRDRHTPSFFRIEDDLGFVVQKVLEAAYRQNIVENDGSAVATVEYIEKNGKAQLNFKVNGNDSKGHVVFKQGTIKLDHSRYHDQTEFETEITNKTANLSVKNDAKSWAKADSGLNRPKTNGGVLKTTLAVGTAIALGIAGGVVPGFIKTESDAARDAGEKEATHKIQEAAPASYDNLLKSIPSDPFYKRQYEGLGYFVDYTPEVSAGWGGVYGTEAAKYDVGTLETTQEDNVSMSAVSYSTEDGTYRLTAEAEEKLDNELNGKLKTQEQRDAFKNAFNDSFDAEKHELANQEHQEPELHTYTFANFDNAQEYILNKVKENYPEFNTSGLTVEADGTLVTLKNQNNIIEAQFRTEHSEYTAETVDAAREMWEEDVNSSIKDKNNFHSYQTGDAPKVFSFVNLLHQNEKAIKDELIKKIKNDIVGGKVTCKDKETLVSLVSNASTDDITIPEDQIDVFNGEALCAVELKVPNQNGTLSVMADLTFANDYTDISEKTARAGVRAADVRIYMENNTLNIATDSGLRAAALAKFNAVLKDGSKAYELADISVREEKDETYTFVASKNGVAELELRGVKGLYQSQAVGALNNAKVVNLSAEAQAEALAERKGIIANSLGAGAMNYESGNDLYIITGNPQEKGKVYKIADGADNGVLAKALSNAVNNDDATNLITDNGAANAWGSWISQETLNKLKTAILTGIDKDTGERLSAGLTTDGDAELYMTFDMGSKKINGKTITYSPTLTVFAVKDKNVLNYKEYSGVSISIDTNELDAEKRETADAKAQAFMLYYCANFRADLNVKGVTVEENYDVTDENSFYTTSWKGGKLYDSEGRDGK